MQKLFFLICLSTLFIAKPLCAEVRHFEAYSIDVPKTWYMRDDGKAISFFRNDEQCAIDIIVAPHQNVAFRELCIFFYERLRGKKAKGDDEGFSFISQNDYNIPSSVRLTFQGDNFVVVTASGSCPELQDVAKTLTMKTQSARPWPIVQDIQVQNTLPKRNTASPDAP